jgi:tetratricopeptide (TPR) repeat protein
MGMQATSFKIEETTFDGSLLPEDSRKPGSAAFHRAVTDYFQQAYGAMGGRVDVVFANGRIEVSWSPATETATPAAEAMGAITPLLKQRRYGEARPLLVALLEAEPQNRDALYNLGMVASDEGQLKEALAPAAARAHADYRSRGGQRTAVLPDFLIGAHALVERCALLTRDPRRYRLAFPGLGLITP